VSIWREGNTIKLCITKWLNRLEYLGEKQHRDPDPMVGGAAREHNSLENKVLAHCVLMFLTDYSHLIPHQ